MTKALNSLHRASAGLLGTSNSLRHHFQRAASSLNPPPKVEDDACCLRSELRCLAAQTHAISARLDTLAWSVEGTDDTKDCKPKEVPSVRSSRRVPYSWARGVSIAYDDDDVHGPHLRIRTHVGSTKIVLLPFALGPFQSIPRTPCGHKSATGFCKLFRGSCHFHDHKQPDLVDDEARRLLAHGTYLLYVPRKYRASSKSK
ncbi:Aste57867_1132 [Aphanomyces stellatus]|uniref:Aste57867_1132 protein n=1 Tax=Aphanomyces stellatus TaxID=120398 RepID=A0A485K4G1_9STRA|nr:hypothetical protein As57867_001131 [Aphanomyces stellatus]VFT78352.1 Aste57867_1132 [Aphanomyces stellatus]